MLWRGSAENLRLGYFVLLYGNDKKKKINPETLSRVAGTGSGWQNHSANKISKCDLSKMKEYQGQQSMTSPGFHFLDRFTYFSSTQTCHVCRHDLILYHSWYTFLVWQKTFEPYCHDSKNKPFQQQQIECELFMCRFKVKVLIDHPIALNDNKYHEALTCNPVNMPW